jgi:hypothetical protein
MYNAYNECHVQRVGLPDTEATSTFDTSTTIAMANPLPHDVFLQNGRAELEQSQRRDAAGC